MNPQPRLKKPAPLGGPHPARRASDPLPLSRARVESDFSPTLACEAGEGRHSYGEVRASLSLLLLLLLTGCGPHGGANRLGSDTRTFTVTVANNVTTFDPAMCQDVETSQVLQNAYEGLVQYSTANTIVPCLADKWSVSKDGLVYTFHLRPGALFQNGMPVTASDVQYTLTRALNPTLGSPVASQYLQDIAGAREVTNGKAAMLKGVTVVDPATVRIAITSPKAYWIDTLTYPTAWIVCKAIAQKKPTTPLTSEDAMAGAGSGAFHVTRWVKDQEVNMEPNAHYWGGAPAVSLRERVVLDPGTRHSLFASGDVDLMRKLQIGDMSADQSDPHLKSSVKVWPRAGVYYLALNQNVYKPFRDVRVRQAFAYATDKEKLQKVVTGSTYPIAQDLLPPGIPGSDPNFAGLPLDVAKARTLLAAAGYANGRGLPPLDISGNEKEPLTQKTIDVLRQMYHDALGVAINEHQMEFGALISAEDRNNALPSYFLGWYADYLDPQDFYSLLLASNSPENHTGYHNAQLDALCARADTEQNNTTRMALYRQAARIAADEVPRIPLYIGVDPELVSARVSGIDDCLMGHLPFKHVTLHTAP